MVSEDDHGPVPVGEPSIIEALKQGLHIGNITNFAAQHIEVDVFLEDGAHPFEGGLPRTHRQKKLPPKRRYRTFDRALTYDDFLLSC